MSLLDKFKKKTKDGFLKIDVQHLIDWDQPNGEGCIASDLITKEGWKVGYMYREEPVEHHPDSGWHFFQGGESEEFMQDTSHFHVFALNTICNYDRDIIPYLTLPVGTHLIRTAGGKFVADDGLQAIRFEKQ